MLAALAAALALTTAPAERAQADLLDPFRCLKPPAIPPIRSCPDIDADRSERVVDFGYGQLYLSRAAVHLSLYRESSGAAVLLYGLCGADMQCLLGEYKPMALKALKDFDLPHNFPGKQKIQNIVKTRIADAFDDDQYEDIAGALTDVAAEGGCIDVQFRSGVNWSQRGAGDKHCKTGLEFGTTSDRLDLVEPYAGKRLFEISVGRKIRLTLFERTSDHLRETVPACSGAPGGTRGCVTTAFAITLERILDDERIRGPVRAIILGVFNPDQADDFLDTLGGNRCLGVVIDRTADDLFDWTEVRSREYCNRGGDELPLN